MKEYPTGVGIFCGDDRCHEPAKAFARKRFDVEKVDSVTVPGADSMVALGKTERLAVAKKEFLIYANAHRAKGALVVSHEGCAGNPVTKEEHFEHTEKLCEEVASWGLVIPVVGLYVNEKEEVEIVCEM